MTGIEASVAYMTRMIASYGVHPRVVEFAQTIVKRANAMTFRDKVRAALASLCSQRMAMPSEVETITPGTGYDSDDCVVMLGALLSAMQIQSRVVALQQQNGGWTVRLDVLNDETGQWRLVDASDVDGLVLGASARRPGTARADREIVGEPILTLAPKE